MQIVVSAMRAVLLYDLLGHGLIDMNTCLKHLPQQIIITMNHAQ